MKAVIIYGDKVVLAKNEREEWELPGGKLELGEDPQACVVREVEEELGLKVSVSRILDSWQYRVRTNRNVVILTYACECTKTELIGSHEHKEVRWFCLDDVPRLPMPEGYKRSVANWASILESARPGL